MERSRFPQKTPVQPIPVQPVRPTTIIDSDDSYYDDAIYTSEASDTSADYYEDEPEEGATSIKINQLPSKKYKPQKDNESCAICLSDFQLNQSLKILPCLHNFHDQCITKWLLTKNGCPLCKTRV